MTPALFTMVRLAGGIAALAKAVETRPVYYPPPQEPFEVPPALMLLYQSGDPLARLLVWGMVVKYLFF